MRRQKISSTDQPALDLESPIKIQFEATQTFVSQTITFDESKFVSVRKRPSKHKFSFEETLSDEWWRAFCLVVKLSLIVITAQLRSLIYSPQLGAFTCFHRSIKKFRVESGVTLLCRLR